MNKPTEYMIQLHNLAMWLEAQGHWYMAQVIRKMLMEEIS